MIAPEVDYSGLEREWHLRTSREEDVKNMNAYALRIWGGQSDSLTTTERVRRVVAGLELQGFTPILHMLKLPIDGKYSDYL